ncbi:MAG: hypothetical protein H6625_03085 [Bdellovibrionaceae bacterium]|nr:hypothetical protein [Pseudobdellovibrionaceae bacterium]
MKVPFQVLFLFFSLLIITTTANAENTDYSDLNTFQQVESLVEAAKLPDTNENYFGTNVNTDNFNWDPTLQFLQEAISHEVIAPQSLIRSFILVAEKRVQNPQITKTLFPGVNLLMDRSVVEALRQLKLNYNYKMSYYENNLAGDQQSLRTSFDEFNNLAKNFSSSVQIILGNKGAIAALALIDTYAKTTRKLIYRFSPPQGSLYKEGDLLAEIQNRIRFGTSSIILIENLNRKSSNLFLKDVQFLLENKALLGNANLMINLEKLTNINKTRDTISSDLAEKFLFYVADKKDSERTQLLLKIAQYADGIHFVQTPQSPLYLKSIINIYIHDALLKIALSFKYRFIPKIENQEALVNELAQAFFEMQQTTDHSLVPYLINFIKNPINYKGWNYFGTLFNCEKVLAESPSEEGLNAKRKLTEATHNYIRAIENAFKM